MTQKKEGLSRRASSHALGLVLVAFCFHGTAAFVPGIIRPSVQSLPNTACLIPTPISHDARHQEPNLFPTVRKPLPTSRQTMYSKMSSTISKDVASAAAAASTVIVKYKSSFLSLFFAFFMGGIFFTSAAAVAASIYGFGLENSKRALTFILILVKRVLSSTGEALKASRDVLMGKETSFGGIKERFKAAWKKLFEEFEVVKKDAAEGVKAIKLEASLYDSVVGITGLIPLQYALNRMMPLTLTGPIIANLKKSLEEATNGKDGKGLPNIKRLTLKNFKTGDKAPQLLQAKLYDVGEENLAFDFDVRWDSNLQADIDLVTKRVSAKIPVSVRNLRFEGVVRVIVTKLMTKEPGWSAALISLKKAPKIGLDVRVMGGEFTRVPWIRTEITKAINEAIANELLWPKRVVASAPVPGKFKPLLTDSEIKALMKDDPLYQKERRVSDSLPPDFKEAQKKLEKSSTLVDMAVSDGEAVLQEVNSKEEEKHERKYGLLNPFTSLFESKNEVSTTK